MTNNPRGRKRRYVSSLGIYYDTSTRGRIGRQHHSYRAGVLCEGRRCRKRFATYDAAAAWIERMKSIERNFWNGEHD